MALGSNHFDSITFLTQFHDGYARTIRDMAAAFYVADETKPGNCGDKIAIITCHDHKVTPADHGEEYPFPSKLDVCNNPEFKLNRAFINLPHINQSADKLFGRIIPAPGGDCKLVA
ncbi:hypothetical protein N7G274_006068 [Stereocaulon virgatum]|uniref:Uncharacterized protein n=1 Tax=Stereocaulon virgatum TaxID=373712 RepID=A0ABR4A6J6_9LECA